LCASYFASIFLPAKLLEMKFKPREKRIKLLGECIVRVEDEEIQCGEPNQIVCAEIEFQRYNMCMCDARFFSRRENPPFLCMAAAGAFKYLMACEIKIHAHFYTNREGSFFP